MNSGDVVVFQYGEDSSYGQRGRLDQACVCDWIAIRGAGLGEHLRALRGEFGPMIAGGDEPTFRDALAEAVGTLDVRHSGSRISQAAAVTRLVHALMELAGHRGEAALTPTHRLVDRIASDPLRPWSLKQLAAEHGLSREHLCRSFRERHGLPPHAYLTRARRRRAVWLLEQTELPLRRVAELSGFERTYTLARHIRDATGTSPANLRAVYQRTVRPGDVKSKTAST